MREVSCECGGSNANCARCQGSGYYTRFEVAEMSSDLGTNVTARKGASSTFSLNKGAQLLPAAGIPSGKVRRAKQRPGTAKSHYECPYCKGKTFRHRMALEQHLRRSPHFKTPNDIRMLIALLRNATTQSDPEPDALAVEDATGRDVHDATRLYAHAYREQGRYGSHPVHDDYSDDYTDE